MLSAQELHRRGVDALVGQRLSAARRLLARARELAEDPDQIARVEASLAFLASETGDTEEAERLCEQALARPGLADETRGIIESQRAVILLRRGLTTESLAAYDACLALLSDPAELGKAHNNRGGVYLAQGNVSRAVADFSAAMPQFVAAGQPVEAAMAAHNLGYAQLLRGELVEALRRMDEAREVLASLSPVSRAICDQDRAEVLMAAGLVTEGRQALREASRALATRRLHQRRGEAELALARSLVVTDPEASLAAARSARRLFLRSGGNAWRVRAEAVTVIAEVELGRSGPALVARGDAVAAELDAQGLDSYATLVRLHMARVLTRRRRYEEAQGRIAAAGIGRDSPLAVRLVMRTARVELAMARGRRAAALREVRAGLAELHAWQSTFGSLDLQTFVVGRGRRLAVHGLGLAVDSGRAATLYEWSERARMLASRTRPIRPPADRQIAADLAELRRINVGADGVIVPDPERDRELRRRVRERAWQNPGSGEVTEPARMDDVRRALGADTALVAWVVSRGRLVALTVTDEAAVVHPLGSFATARGLLTGMMADLDVAAADLPGPLAHAIRAGLTARIGELADLLVTPLLGRLGDRRVVATPSGGLAGTPWTLLPGMVGRPIAVSPSATAWLEGRFRPAVGATRPADSAGFVAGPRVPRARAEVEAAAKVWDRSTVLVDDEATEAAVTELAGRVDVLHVAAHGRHSADNPLFSGVELVDGSWYGYDIDRLPRVPQVVVLSACEVGRSSVRFGEELIGMTAAWLQAGAACVLASPTAVNDEVAHDVLTAMHDRLAGGLAPAVALAEAVPAVTDDTAPAPFACFGSGF